MINENKPNLKNIKTVFTDYDGSFRQSGGKMLRGVDKLFDKVISREGQVFLLTNRSPEACKSDPLIYEKFGDKSPWKSLNKEIKTRVIAATGALFLDKYFTPINIESTSLNFTQRRKIADALLPYIDEISLIEWVEKDIKKRERNKDRTLYMIAGGKILNKLTDNKVTESLRNNRLNRLRINQLNKLKRFSNEAKVRKFHFIYEEDNKEKEIRRRSVNNKNEKEHVIRQKNKEIHAQIKNKEVQVQIIEYMRKAPRDWYLKRTRFVASPKDILRLLRKNDTVISKIVVGFKTKDEAKLEYLQTKVSNDIFKTDPNIIINPDLSNLHILNKRDKAIAVEDVCKDYGLDMSECMMVGNSGIDIPPGILLAKHGGIFVYVGHKGESKKSMKERFYKELKHPLLKEHYLMQNVNEEEFEKKIDKLIKTKHIVFLDPLKNINGIYKRKKLYNVK